MSKLKKRFQFRLSHIATCIVWFAVAAMAFSNGWLALSVMVTTAGIGYCLSILFNWNLPMAVLLGLFGGCIIVIFYWIYISHQMGAGWGAD